MALILFKHSLTKYFLLLRTHAAGYVTKPPLRKGVADALVENATSSKCIIILIWSHFCRGQSST